MITVTDKIIPRVYAWHSRPLESIYAVVFLNAMFFKAREGGKVVTKALYNIMGINSSGHKDILGFYSCESERTHFWLSVLNDLKARGAQNILISCIDGLKGFPEAISSALSKTEVQLCVIHQIRSSPKSIASKNQKEFMDDLKTVYKAESQDTAEYNLLQPGEK